MEKILKIFYSLLILALVAMGMVISFFKVSLMFIIIAKVTLITFIATAMAYLLYIFLFKTEKL